MKISLIAIGKTNFDFLVKGIEEYQHRLKRYGSFEIKIISDVKNAKSLPTELLKIKEGEAFLSVIRNDDDVVLLDENGSRFSSTEFAKYIETSLNQNTKHLVFVIGGAYGFSNEMYKRAKHKISLSPMTFSHQLVRLVFMEQVYRAFTIIRGEPYHHS